MSREAKLSSTALLMMAGLSMESAAAQSAGSQTLDPSLSSAQTVYSKDKIQQFTGPDDLFSGEVNVDLTFPDLEKTAFSGAFVTFQPSARTAWHDHPAGQHMVVTKGEAITATRDGQVLRFSAGEAVWCPEDVDHWHGAMPHTAMTHFVVTGNKDGSAVRWKEKVSGEEYLAAVQSVSGDKAYPSLDLRQQSLARVGALAAASSMDGLKDGITDALDQQVSINELKEVFIHLYPYGGFPKSLNALVAMMSVVDQRKSEGKNDIVGVEPNELPMGEASQSIGTQVQTELVGRPVEGALFDFAPVANVFLQKHLFGDVFARGVLSHQDRELLTLAMLSAMEGAESQVRSHVGMAMNTGVTEAQMRDLAVLLKDQVEVAASERLVSAIDSVIE